MMPDMESIKKHFSENDRFCSLNGIKLIEVEEGRAITRLTVEDRHLNGLDIIQGGAVFTLADLAFAAASNSHGNAAVGISTTMSHFKAARKGDVLTAEAREISRNHKLGTYLVDIKNSQDELIATFQGMVYIKKDSFPPEL